ncbi:MAG TPA: cupin domain-containing protein, partial [Candidatus Baltobacteraceae bacterium]|nr:cupin domain-containing protein [Candidatus Baltobacteraceae bacterium]
RDHERDARALAAKTGAKIAASEGDAPLLSGPVARVLRGGDELLGARVVALEGLKTAGEIALHFPKQRAVVVGDALWGDPAGSLRLMPAEKLSDPARAVLSLRTLWALRPQHLLTGDGACIFGCAREVLARCLESGGDASVHRINLDELTWRMDDGSDPEQYRSDAAEIGFYIGAERLGYQMGRLPPGRSFCPNHWHAAEEELLIVFEGTPRLETPRGSVRLRKGDFVAFPVGPGGAHKIINDTPETTTILLIANTDANDVCFYPDSRKVLVEASDLLVRDNPELDYFDGE